MDDLDRAAKAFLEAAPRSLVARLLPGYRIARGGRGAAIELVWNKRSVDHLVDVVGKNGPAALHFEVWATPRVEVPARCSSTTRWRGSNAATRR